MTNELIMKSIIEAIEIIQNRKVDLIDGPEQPWKFLYDAKSYLIKERDRTFEAQWSEVMS